MKTTREAFHALLRTTGLQFTTKNIDGMGTKLSSDYTDIYLLKTDVPALESICESEGRDCIWPVVGTYDPLYTIRRVTLWK